MKAKRTKNPYVVDQSVIFAGNETEAFDDELLEIHENILGLERIIIWAPSSQLLAKKIAFYEARLLAEKRHLNQWLSTLAMLFGYEKVSSRYGEFEVDGYKRWREEQIAKLFDD